jgi:hypothetical protein
MLDTRSTILTGLLAICVSAAASCSDRSRGSGADAATERDAAPQLKDASLAAAGTGGSSEAGAGGGGTAGRSSGTQCGGIAIPKGTGAASAGVVGDWSDVTPAGISLKNADFNGDNYGAQDVLVDPVRASDLYAFFCHQGVFKSSDYGLTWNKVNRGENAAAIDGGKPWGAAIDTDRCRDPKQPPTLYLTGSQGAFWTSFDGGVNWQRSSLPEDGKPRPQDAYDVDVDPYDGKHLIVGFHEESGLAESSDGGQSWRSVTLAGGMSAGVSWYGFFIDTGAAATTRMTWLMIAQATGGDVGTWRTDDGGASWKRVESNEHGHGQAQLFQAAGVVYMAGVYGTNGWGVYRSTDHAATWTHVGSGGSQNGVYGTGKYVYAQSGGANAGGTDQSQSERAALPEGSAWTVWPVKIGNGPKHAAVTYDGAHYIVVGGNWLSGLWRYVEP